MAKHGTIGVIVDDYDNVIEHKDFADMKPMERCRDTGIFLFNDRGEILVAKRSMKKSSMPGYWGPAASGSVEAHETYEENAYKELEEELGIKGVELTFVGNLYLDFEKHRRFSGIFKGIWNGDISDLTLQDDEVDEARWISLDELFGWIDGEEKVLSGMAPVLNAIGIKTRHSTVEFVHVLDRDNNLLYCKPRDLLTEADKQPESA